MNKIFSFIISIIFISLLSCNPRIYPQSAVMNQETMDSHGNPMLLGRCSKERLQEKPYDAWFNKNYTDYKLDTTAAEILKEKLHGKKIEILMGTWCGDSRREVPRMFKILDYCGIKQKDIELVMLDSRDSVYKQSPAHEERGLHIHRVPDLLIFEKGKEMGRIVESPIVSLEKDMLAIINGEGYVPNYRIVPLLVKTFEQQPAEKIKNNLYGLATQVRPLMGNASELNSYGHVLMAAKEMNKAEIVFILNTMLYPDNANMFDILGDYYSKTGNKMLAKENYQKALQVKPDHEHAKKMLETLN